MVDISKSQVKKLGRQIRRTLRQSGEVSEDDLDLLQKYRVLHQPPMRRVFDFLVEKSKKQNKGSVVVYRLKRIDTIVRKIERYSSMDLSTMQDIAGCRAIVYSLTQIGNLVEDFRRSDEFEIIEEYDYITNPRPTGYRSFHLVIRPKDEIKVVEVQLRIPRLHEWATMVEITDLVFKVKLKEGQDHPDLFNFHRVLSKESLTLSEKKEVVRIEKNLDIIRKLITLFKSNYFISIERWVEAISKGSNAYLIMELDDKYSPSFTFFESFDVAEEAYFEKFSRHEPEMVLIHSNQSDLYKLRLAYSNYVLTSHPSVRNYLNILSEVIVELKRRREFKQQRNLHGYLSELLSFIQKSFSGEIKIMNEKVEEKQFHEDSDISFYKSWRDDLIDRIQYIIDIKENLDRDLAKLDGPNLFEKIIER